MAQNINGRTTAIEKMNDRMSYQAQATNKKTFHQQIMMKEIKKLDKEEQCQNSRYRFYHNPKNLKLDIKNEDVHRGIKEVQLQEHLDLL